LPHFTSNGLLAQYLVSSGADVKVQTNAGWSPLKIAVYENHLDMVRLLLSSGAEVNEKDKQGRTPLMWASIKGSSDIARVLIQSGADVNAADNFGFTCWQFASENKHSGTMQLLRESGAKDFKRSFGLGFSRRSIRQNLVAKPVFLQISTKEH
jgi:ankyrin repeat protein